MKKWLIYLSLLGFLASWQLPSSAWDITIPSQDNAESRQVWLSNDRDLPDVEVYLVHLDLDAAADQVFQSWSLTQNWQTGIMPVFASRLDIPAFEAFPALSPPTTCPATHRCFLAFVAVAAGGNLAQVDEWAASAVLPLSVEAAYERLPSQTLYLSRPASRQNGGYDTVNTVGGSPAFSETTAVPSAPTATDTGNKSTTTEKPDIFRLEGQRVLYANGQAERLQIIDVSDPQQPRLLASTPLTGTPREIYALAGRYVLLQSLASENATQLTVYSPDAQGGLVQNGTLQLPGYFIESRRRNEVIYSIAQDNDPSTCCYNNSQLRISAITIDAQGQPQLLNSTTVSGYDPKVAIFSDYLVVARHDISDWRASQVQVFDLTQAAKPLVDLGSIPLAGRVPSEFHLNVDQHLLRLVYNPEDRSSGSTLGIYDLTQPGLPLRGEVGKIAPGESLRATRFVGDTAYVVTFLNTDPLWVIDVSNPDKPQIRGELKVPGWSELMFFNNNRLFAVGIDDQPAPGETLTWARRVAASLFDVSDPTQPLLLDRYTPLVGEASHSDSPALRDERALLLDWQTGFAALPLESWEIGNGNHLQLLDFSQDRFQTAGRLALNLPVQRSMALDNGLLGVLGDQAFLTATWGEGQAKVLAELELARNIVWLQKNAAGLWAAAQGNQGYHRFYRYDPADLSKPAQRWDLPRGYANIRLDSHQAVFYNDYPLTIQVLNLESGVLQPSVQLEADPSTSSDTATWYYRSDAFVQAGHFYLVEERQADIKPLLAGLPVPSEYTYAMPTEWRLHDWHLTTDKPVAGPEISVPGKPVALTEDGKLLSLENLDNNQTRLNLLSLDAGKARLESSLTLECTPQTQQWTAGFLYLTCGNAPYYYGGPILATTAETTDSNPSAPPAQPPALLLRIAVGQQLTPAGRWELDSPRNLLAVEAEYVLLGTSYYYYGPYYGGAKPIALAEPAVSGLVADRMIMPPYADNSCTLYRLGNGLEKVMNLELCPGSDQVVLTPNAAYQARGFVDIQTLSW